MTMLILKQDHKMKTRSLKPEYKSAIETDCTKDEFSATNSLGFIDKLTFSLNVHEECNTLYMQYTS